MKIILNGLYKGGIGKTYQNVMLARKLSERGYKVLMLDFDPQMNATTFLTNKTKGEEAFKEQNIFKAIRDKNLMGNILELNDKLHYVAGSKGVNQFDVVMNKRFEKDRHLYIKGLIFQAYQNADYDFVVMDMSPTSSSLNTSVMSAASHHIIMTQSEYFSMNMVPEYLHDIRKLQETYGIKSAILGISIGMVDGRSSHERKVITTLQNNFEGLVFDTVTKRKAQLKKYSAEGYPEKLYAVDRKAMAEYDELTGEILERLNLSQQKNTEEIETRRA